MTQEQIKAMTWAQKKAKSLVEKMFVAMNGKADTMYDGSKWVLAKACAIICVDEIQKAIDRYEYETPNKQFNYWNNVKKEIQKL